MDQLEVILSRTRKLARDKQLDLDTATQIAIDEAAETHNEPLDEMLLSVATYLSLLILAIIGSSAVVTALVASNRVQGVADMAVLYAHDRAVTNGMPNKNLLVAGVGEFLRSAESAKRLEIVAISAAVESAESSLGLCARYQNPLGVGINSAVICRSSRAESFLITGGT